VRRFARGHSRSKIDTDLGAVDTSPRLTAGLILKREKKQGRIDLKRKKEKNRAGLRAGLI
jgi:hypothetical protein